MEFPQGKIFLHYKILDKLGEGGMGVVYLAQDLKLDRKVAVKFLPNYISADLEDQERFKREARAAANLNHPNIATVYSIEESGGQIFIVMEYIKGKELTALINESLQDSENEKSVKGLPLDNIIDYAIQIAGALEAAHRKGIIHRDIKSRNIMITDEGQVKIMDFGLAKIKGGSQYTKIGTAVGTTAYMSPEQIRGENVDHRSDIWSFGIVLYEMLTGILPFSAEYDQATIYLIMNEVQKPVSSLREKLPTEFQAIISKCLAKDPVNRYKDLGEIKSILSTLNIYNNKSVPIETHHKTLLSKRALKIAASVIIIFLIFLLIFRNFKGQSGKNTQTETDTVKRIAVLPFDNIKNDPKTNFLGFALADQIIGSLAYDKDILVRPASSVKQFQNKDVTSVRAGKELNVDYILDGSYLKDADVIRLNLELVNIHKDNIVWKNDFDVKYVNTFKLQDIVSRKVTKGLKIRFSSNKKYTSVPKNSVVYEYYLKSLTKERTMNGTRQAISLLKKTISLDSTYAPAYVELGGRYDYLADFDPKEKGKIKAAESSYLKALSLNSNSLDALNSLAGLYTESGKDLKAVNLLRKALKINPDNAGAHYILGYIFRYTGLQDKALREMKKAWNLDPGNSNFESICITYVYSGKLGNALKSLAPFKENPFVLGWKGEIYLRMGKKVLAKKFLRHASRIDSAILGRWADAMLSYINGNFKKGKKDLQVFRGSNIYDGEDYYNCANVYGLLGDTKNCIKMLRIAVNHGFFNYSVISRDSFLNSVKDDTAYYNILKIAKNASEKFSDELLYNAISG